MLILLRDVVDRLSLVLYTWLISDKSFLRVVVDMLSLSNEARAILLINMLSY